MKLNRLLTAFFLCLVLCARPISAAEDSSTQGFEAYLAFIALSGLNYALLTNPGLAEIPTAEDSTVNPQEVENHDTSVWPLEIDPQDIVPSPSFSEYVVHTINGPEITLIENPSMETCSFSDLKEQKMEKNKGYVLEAILNEEDKAAFKDFIGNPDTVPGEKNIVQMEGADAKSIMQTFHTTALRIFLKNNGIEVPTSIALSSKLHATVHIIALPSVGMMDPQAISRLKKVGLIEEKWQGLSKNPKFSEKYGEDMVLIPLLVESNFFLCDSLKISQWNNEIKSSLQKIAAIGKAMISFLDDRIEQIKNSDYTPDVHVCQSVSAKSLSSKKGIIAVVGIPGKNLQHTPTRLGYKHQTLQLTLPQHKEKMIATLTTYKSLWSHITLAESAVPNDISAFLFFELFLELFIRTQSSLEDNSNLFSPMMYPHFLTLMRACFLPIRLLNPHIENFGKKTKVFSNFHLSKKLIAQGKEMELPDYLFEEVLEYEAYAKEAKERQLQEKKAAAEARKQAEKEEAERIANTPTQGKEKDKASQASTLSHNQHVNAQRREAQASAAQSRREGRDQRQNESAQKRAQREKERAEALVKKHNEEIERRQAEAQQKRLEELRLGNIFKIHELPDPSVMDSLISKLKGKHADHFAMLFGSHQDNDRTMSDQNIKDLAAHFKNFLLSSGVRCGHDFYNFVLHHIHVRHDSDDGDLLPSDYIDKVRAGFILFGVKPSDWIPQTDYDDKNMDKYKQRLTDRLLYSSLQK